MVSDTFPIGREDKHKSSHIQVTGMIKIKSVLENEKKE